MPVTALTITVTLPSLGIDHVRQIGAGSIATEGYGPSVEPSYVVSPQLARLAITGLAPDVFVTLLSVPDAGAVTITGLAPSLLQDTAFRPDPATLTITGYSYSTAGLSVWNGSGAPASQNAAVSGSGYVKRIGSGVLNSQAALSLVGTGVRKVTATGTLQSGPASLSGTILTVTSVLRSEAATILARGDVREFDPNTRRLRPQRVNRYNVTLKPSPRRRVRNPNRRRPIK